MGAPKGVTQYVRNESEIAEEQEFCLRLRIDGCNDYRTIARVAAEHFGRPMSHETARVRVSTGNMVRVEPVAAEHRQLAVTRVEERIARLKLRMNMVDPRSELSIKIEVLIENAEIQLAKLLGTYAATQIDVTHKVVGSIDDEINQLMDELLLNDPKPATKAEA